MDATFTPVQLSSTMFMSPVKPVDVVMTPVALGPRFCAVRVTS